ncbi:MAG: ATP-binding protein [Bacteroidota bacterium]
MKSILPKKKNLQILGVIIILLSGGFYLHHTWKKFKKNQADEILQISRSIVATLPTEDLKYLEVKINDTVKPKYKNLKNTLYAIINTNPKARFAYLYMQKNNKLYFIVDSEPAVSNDCSPPGQQYTEANKAYYQPFRDGKEYVIGPAKDRWGTWVSVLVPIKNKNSGETIAVYAMDFNSKKWNTILIHDVSESIVLILLLLTTFILLFKIKSKNKILKEDIQKRKQTEAKLVVAKENAEESDRLKSAFLANMSHEIRTPMNGIMGFAELLKRPNLSPLEQQEFISIIDHSGDRMLNIINDIIDISKIEAGLMSVSISETNINKQMEYIYNFFKPEMDQKGIEIRLQNGLSMDKSTIKTDPEKIYAILTNLVKNAIKFTTTGCIEFGYILKSVNTDSKNNLSVEFELEFYVRDTGIGIPKNQLAVIFERFRQSSESMTRSYEGAGLGLSISKAFVEMLGGKIWVESKKDKGSTFYFTIPYHYQQIDNTEKTPSNNDLNSNIKKIKTVIAEDDEISAYLITKLLEPFAKEIIRTKTGLETVMYCQNNPDVDLILMDIQMPEMNGYEAIREIRKFNKEVIIIAQTAHVLSEDKINTIEFGCNNYISKPIKKEELQVLIHQYFSSKEK